MNDYRRLTQREKNKLKKYQIYLPKYRRRVYNANIE